MKIQSFGLGVPATEESNEILGGKGAGLVFMSNHGVTVPPGFIFPTTGYELYKKSPAIFQKTLSKHLKEWMPKLHAKFGYMPLVSVRSGARVSMPGMMDTILNVGLDAQTYPAWAERLGTVCAADSFSRLVEMYGSVVKGIDRKDFEGLELQDRLKLYQSKTNEEFPDAEGQLVGAIMAVFQSWNNPRAQVYRQMHGYSDEWGTAAVVQAMVFGNFNDQSGTGVLFTRHPDTGENEVTGEFLINAQGEDVVAGIRTPMPLTDMVEWNPAVAGQLMNTVTVLEHHKKDVQDVEFTIQDGELFILQTRNAKRSAIAAIRIAVEMHEEGTLTEEEALKRVIPRQYDLAQQRVLDPEFKNEPNWTAIPVCSGVVTGVVVKDNQSAIDCKESCILVREETSPDDIVGINAANAVLTNTGGATSHAAVVARGMNKPCVVGLGLPSEAFNEVFRTYSLISIDGATGRIWKGSVPTISAADSPWLVKFNHLLFKGVQLWDDTPGEQVAVLDLGDDLLDVPKAFEKFKAQLALNKKFIVSLVPGDAALAVYRLHEASFLVDRAVELDALVGASGLDYSEVLVESFNPLPLKYLKEVQVVHGLEDLINASGPYQLPLGFTPTPVYEKIMKWQKKDGVEEFEMPYTESKDVMITKRLCA